MTAWILATDLSVASDPQRRVVRLIGEILEQLSPARLDPKRQVVEYEPGTVRVSLQHDSEPGLWIDVVVCDGWVNFYGVMGHDEAYSDGKEPEDAWESEWQTVEHEAGSAHY